MEMRFDDQECEGLTSLARITKGQIIRVQEHKGQGDK